MADKCENRGCGAWDEYTKGSCLNKWGYGCQGFTTTPTQSITVERLKELEGSEKPNIARLYDRISQHISENLRLAGEVERLKGKNICNCAKCSGIDTDSYYDVTD